MTKILVVDDDPAQRARLRHMLEGAGYNVVTAPDAIQGLVTVTRDPPDLILSDILMPRMDGFTFIREMKGRPDLRVIPFLFVTSTLVSEDDRQFAQMLGAEAILSRTDDANAALAIIESCVKRHTRAPRPSTHGTLPHEESALTLESGAPVGEKEETATESHTLPSESPAPSALPSTSAQEQAAFLQQYSEQKVVQLESKIAELERSNRTLEERAQELASLAAQRDELLRTVQAHAADLERLIAERERLLQTVQAKAEDLEERASEREQLLQTVRAKAEDLEERAAEHSQQIATLADVSKTITSTPSLEPMLDELVRRAADVTHATDCSLYLYNPGTNTFHGASSSSLDRETIRRRFFPADESSPIQHILGNSTATAVCHIDGHLGEPRSPSVPEFLPRELDGQAILIAPLVARSQIHGLLLCADASSERIFGDEAVTVVSQLADQAALALENARLLYETTEELERLRGTEEQRRGDLARMAAERDQLVRDLTARARELEQQVQERRAQLAAVAQISKSINAGLDPENVLDEIVRSAAALIRADTCNLFLFNPETDTFHGAASSSMPRDAIQQLYFAANHGEPLDSIVKGQSAVALDDAEHDSPNMPILQQTFHARAALITPVVARGQVLGLLLCAAANARRAFSSEEIDLLTTFADQAASALENARLSYEATRALDELHTAQQQLALVQKSDERTATNALDHSRAASQPENN